MTDDVGILDLVHDSVWVCAAETGAVLRWNRASAELYGVPEADALGKDVFSLLGDEPDARKELAAKGSWRGEVRRRATGGDALVVKVRWHRRDGPDGTTQIVECGQDLTERRTTAENEVRTAMLIEQMQSELAHAARVATLGELTASIAHEVNQPLSAILVTAATVQRWLAQEPPNMAEAVSSNQRIMRDARRAADIILHLRSMATKSDPEPTITPIGPAIEAAFRLLRYEIRTTRADVVLDLAPGMPDVLVDRVQLQQVVVNLARNGLQAMVAAERRVLTVRAERAPGDMVRVLVEDSGPGIPEDQKDRLFTSFFTTKATGMGIGLRICRSIVEAHGGTITAANRPGGGAAIAFELPSVSAEVIEA